uniref:Uncharacterized protein n=1 Tax=Solanum lycopersicum TaxID=4081 RepID=A0A3Q7GWR2_SOLLC
MYFDPPVKKEKSDEQIKMNQLQDAVLLEGFIWGMNVDSRELPTRIVGVNEGTPYWMAPEVILQTVHSLSIEVQLSTYFFVSPKAMKVFFSHPNEKVQGHFISLNKYE